MKTFDQCVKAGGLKASEADERIALKEIQAAKRDLASCRRSVDQDDWTWAIVQAYYAAFHAARALLVLKGWRERSHECIPPALERLYLNELALHDIDLLNQLRYLRMKANYELEDLQESTSTHAADLAAEFITHAEAIVRKMKK